MTENDKNYYKLKYGFCWKEGETYGTIIYRPLWMIAANIVLKALQPWTKSPYLVVAVTTFDDNDNPHFIRYCFGKTHFDDGYFERIKGSFLCSRFCERYYK